MLLSQLDLSNPEVNPIAKFSDIAGFANVIISGLVSFAGLAAFIMALIGAFTIMTADGESEKFNKGKKIFVNAIVGLIIVITSYLAIRVVEFVLGIKIFL